MAKKKATRSGRQKATTAKRRGVSADMGLSHVPLRTRPRPKLSDPRGSTGLGRNWQNVDDEWHSKLRGVRAIRTFREMRDNDAICGCIYYSMDTAIRHSVRDVSIKPAEDSQFGNKIADHVSECFDDMQSTKDEFISDVTSMIWAGWSIFGTSHKIRRGHNAPHEILQSNFDDGLVGWKDLPIRNQETIKEWRWRKDGKLLGCIQAAPPNHVWTYLDIEDDDLTLFRTISNKQSPEGRSLFRNAYRSWFYLKRIQELEAIGIEKDMAGILVLQMPLVYFQEDATDAQQNTLENYRQVAERIRRGEHESLTYPGEEDADGKTGFKASLMQSGGRRPIDTNEIIKRIESRVALSVVAEAPLLGTQGDRGSWALSSTKTHMLAVATNALRNTIKDQIDRTVIPRLVHLNGWPTALSPTWEWPDLETDETAEFASAMAALTTAGLLIPDADIERYIRMRYGLPMKGEISEGQMDDAVGADAGEPNRDIAAEAAAQAVMPIEQQRQGPGEVVDLDEAAAFLGVSRNRIRNAVRSGQLPGARVGNAYRIVRQDLMDYMHGYRHAA
jgi:excisionase family DNA binding protein